MLCTLRDALPLCDARTTGEGYLAGTARAARTGIQLYTGDEVGRRDLDYVRVYRPPEEVFDEASLRTWFGRPITNDHPVQGVTADSWKDLAAGHIANAIKKDGDWVVVPVAICDAAVISDVQSGKREVSMGYTCRLDMTPGETPEGEVYDAVQRDIRINHLAVVDRARAGSAARIATDTDPRTAGSAGEGSQPTGTPSSTGDSAMRTISIGDGLTVTVEDRDAQLIEKAVRDAGKALETVQAKLADAEQAREKATTDLAARDGTIEELRAQVADLEAKSSPEAVAAAAEKMAKDRQGLEDMAKKLGVSNFKPTGDAEADRAAIYAEKRGTKALDSVKERFGESADKAITAALDEMVLVGRREYRNSEEVWAERDEAEQMTGDGEWSGRVLDRAGVKLRKRAAA